MPLVQDTNYYSLAPRGQIVLFGDSITQNAFVSGDGASGFAAQIAHRYSRRADVLNRGYSGYTTRFGRSVLPRLPLGAATLLTVIFFGANDAALLSEDPHHHVPLEEYKDHLQAMVQDAKHRTRSNRIVLVAPPPVHHAMRFKFQKDRYGEKATGRLQRRDDTTGEYAAACRAVATSENVPVLDLWSMMRAGEDCIDSDDPQDVFRPYLSDGLHLSARGNAFVGENLIALIDASFPELAVVPCQFTGSVANSGSSSQLKVDMPYHDKIDHADVEASFAKK